MGGLSGSLPSRCALGDVPKRTFGGRRTMERPLGRSLSADLEGPEKIFDPSLNNRLWLHIWGGTAAPPDVQSHAPQKKNIFRLHLFFRQCPPRCAIAKRSRCPPDIPPADVQSSPPPREKKKNTHTHLCKENQGRSLAAEEGLLSSEDVDGRDLWSSCLICFCMLVFKGGRFLAADVPYSDWSKRGSSFQIDRPSCSWFAELSLV